jgi:hypothetical protein
MGRSLSNLGLFACFIALAGAGCGGGTDYSNDNNNPGGGGGGTVVTPVVTGDAPFGNTRGTRGTIPISLYASALATTTPATYFVVSPTQRQRLTVPTGSFISVPTIYADRKFDHFELNGTTVSTGAFYPLPNETTLSLASLPPTVGGTLTAVYVPYNPGAGVPFTPNYNQSDYARFDSMPLKVYLDPAVIPNEGVRQRIIAAMDKWVNATGGLISYTLVQSDSAADISFLVADSLAVFNPSDGETLAVTTSDIVPSTTGGLGRIRKSNIYGVAKNFNVQNSIDQKQFEDTMAHEFGHALGIYSASDTGDKSHSPNPQDLMYPYVNNIIGEITANDVGTIANIYRAEYDAAIAAGRAK